MPREVSAAGQALKCSDWLLPWNEAGKPEGRVSEGQIWVGHLVLA